MNTRSLNREILDIGVPSFLETLFTTFAAIIDSKMVAVMGVSAISAVSVTNQPRLFLFSIFFAIQTVTTSLVAKYSGRNDREAANRVFDHALKLVVILSIGLGLISVLLAEPILRLFSGQKDTLESSVIYFRIVMAGTEEASFPSLAFWPEIDIMAAVIWNMDSGEGSQWKQVWWWQLPSFFLWQSLLC